MADITNFLLDRGAPSSVGNIMQPRERTPQLGPYNEDPRADAAGLDLLQYWRMLLKHRYVVLGALVVALGCGVATIMLTTPIYTATATLQIDKEQVKIANMQGYEARENVTSEEFFQTQYGLLKSRSLAERTVDKLDLVNDPAFLKTYDLTGTDGVKPNASAVRNALIGVLRGGLGVSPVRGSRLVNVSFSSPDPNIASRAANAISENFIDANLDRRIEASAYYRKLLEEQLASEKQKLEAAERQLAAYATQQQIINIPGSGDATSSSSSANQSLTASSLLTLTTALAAAKGERIRAEARWKQSQGLSENQSGTVEILQDPTIQMLRQERAKLQAEYEDKGKVYKPEFGEMQQLAARIAALDRELQASTRSVQNSLRNQYEIALSQERAFEGQVNQLKGSVLNLRERSIQYDILQREVDTSRQLYEGLLQSYKEVGVAGGLSNNNIFIIDRAEPPGGPSKPRPVFIMAVAAMIGLAFGIGMVFLLELIDESIRTPEDVESKLGLSLLGSIPKLDRGVLPAQALGDIRSPFAEAYYSVRTALQFSTNEGAPSSLLVTSARPSEGKSTTATAVATNFAKLGRKVLLVDADMRNPSLHRVMGVENSAGLSNYLTAASPLSQLLQSTETPNLSFMPTGPLPPNPAELLAGNRIRALLDDAQDNDFEIVIIDGPPVMGLADAPMLAATVAGTVLVVEAGGTGRNLARIAIRRLGVGGGRILGVLLTKFDARKASYGYGYGYGYAYEYNYGSSNTRKRLKGAA